ncbi:hypothetical protein ACFFGV_15535 [Pontibacillus salicampi]|uniref:YneQ n=1 Tax=Pontibacillus salicampi TaxID=1449801 RepID=A0ABV6LRG0_9BACI
MAFGVTKQELAEWKRKVKQGDIAFLTHYWLDDRFPDAKTVTKVGSCNQDKLIAWGKQYNLQAHWIHENPYPHFDVMGEKQLEVLRSEGLTEHIKRFNLSE